MFNLTMNHKIKKYASVLALLQFLYIPQLAFAELAGECPQMKVQATNGQTLVFGEYEFEHGIHDLMISNIEKSEIKRVTYSGKTNLNKPNEQSCIYKALAIAQGGDWGWHLAWEFNDKPGVYYSRMDSEAWVSTPAKRIIEENADVLELTVENEQVTLHGYASAQRHNAIFVITSDDEGRNW